MNLLPPTHTTDSAQRKASSPDLTHTPGRRDSAGYPEMGSHSPTVVHSHEITDQQEGIGEHAHCDLKAEGKE